MRIDEIEARLSAIKGELDAPDANLDALEEEIRSLQTEKQEIIDAEAKRAEMRDKIASGEGVKNVIEKQEDIPMPAERKITIESEEYRSAFYAMIRGEETEEQRSALLSVDGTTGANGDAIALPKTLDTKIWDNIHTAHPILEDITMLQTGIVMEVTRHVALTPKVTKKHDAAEGAGAEDNTFVKVVLAGMDYEKYVELTYAQAKMSQGALEDYLAQEIAAELGEALAKDVFARIKADAGADQKKVATGDYFADIGAVLALASRAGDATLYVSAASYYAILSAVDSNGQPIFRDGLILQAKLKKDEAAGTDIVAVDPKMFVMNVIQPVMIESAKDVKVHHIIVSGYMRAEGTLRDTKAAAYISAT